jgi:hypothetical protein
MTVSCVGRVYGGSLPDIVSSIGGCRRRAKVVDPPVQGRVMTSSRGAVSRPPLVGECKRTETSPFSQTLQNGWVSRSRVAVPHAVQCASVQSAGSVRTSKGLNAIDAGAPDAR